MGSLCFRKNTVKNTARKSAGNLISWSANQTMFDIFFSRLHGSKDFVQIETDPIYFSTSGDVAHRMHNCTIVHPDYVVKSFYCNSEMVQNWDGIETTHLCFLAKHRGRQIEVPCKKRQFFVLKLFLSHTLTNDVQLSKCLHQRGKVAYGMPLRKLDIIALKPLTSITFDLTWPPQSEY